MIYENGKTCYGRYKDGTCNDYSADKLAEYETVTKIEVLVISDAEECSLESLNQWSDCSGEDGRDINCGPGRLTRFFRNFFSISSKMFFDFFLFLNHLKKPKFYVFDHSLTKW